MKTAAWSPRDIEGRADNSANRIRNMIQVWGRYWDGFTADLQALFVEIALADEQHQPLTITEAGQKAGMTKASAARNVRYLESWVAENRKEPLELLEIRPDPHDGRTKRVHLTAKGRRLFSEVCEAIQ